MNSELRLKLSHCGSHGPDARPESRLRPAAAEPGTVSLSDGHGVTGPSRSESQPGPGANTGGPAAARPLSRI